MPHTPQRDEADRAFVIERLRTRLSNLTFRAIPSFPVSDNDPVHLDRDQDAGLIIQCTLEGGVGYRVAFSETSDYNGSRDQAPGPHRPEAVL